MFYIVESQEQLDWIKNQRDYGGYVDVISTNDLYHPHFTQTVAVYIHITGEEHGHIIPIDHDEGLNVSKQCVYDILKEFTTLYTVNKKELLYHFNLQDATDISLLYSMNYYDRLDIPNNNSTINWYYSKYSKKQDLNKLIPLTKLYERCESTYDSIFKKQDLDLSVPPGFKFYNDLATNIFYLIEQQGLGINPEPFIELHKPREPIYSIEGNTVYTQYNLYNVTSRPTNAFNSVNFAALPKTKEHREVFVPKNDYFVEFDFDGYHLRLLAEQIGYELNEESAHKQLAEVYYGKKDITDEEYLKAKQINFHAIYGKIPEEHKDLEIFKLTQEYINNMWSVYSETGVVCNPISGKPFTKDVLKDMHPAKLMNYMMQSLETSRNVLILKEVLRYLSGKKSKVVLYVYDAIIIDFDKEDGKETLEELKEILEQNKKYPVKFKFSKNLSL